MKNWRNYLSTIIGAVVAIANAWITIEWDNFVLNGNSIMKLALSAAIALGGYMTSINKKSLNERSNESRY